MKVIDNSRPDFNPKGPLVVEHRGRFYINIFRPGFNSPSNNRNGYATAASAEAASNGYASKVAA